jgi:uncharacterized protein DUF1559
MRTQDYQLSGNAKGKRRVTTALEIFVSIMLVLVIIAMLLPTTMRVDGVGPWQESSWHLFDIANAMHDYADHYGTFPPAVVYDKQGKPLYSWRVLLLPYLKGQTLYSQFKLDEPWDSPNNEPLLQQMPHVYLTPSQYEQKELYATHYQVFTGGGAIFDASPKVRLLSLKDIAAAGGNSKTILVVEAAEPVPWTKPEDLPYSPDQPLPKLGGLFVRKGFHVMMADGGTRWMPVDTDESTIRAMITWNGGEPFRLPE